MPWLLVLGCFKLGDSFGSAMVRPMLVDVGLTLTDLGVLLGIVGFVGLLAIGTYWWYKRASRR